MAKRAAACPADAQKPGPLIMVLAGETSLAEICELSTGVVIDPHLVVPYLSAADMQTIVFDGADRPITGSNQRTFRGLLRRAIQVRDRHCQHPSGCDDPIDDCDLNHTTDWADGGRTELDDGNIECHPHNRIEELHRKAPPPGTPRAGPPPKPARTVPARSPDHPDPPAADRIDADHIDAEHDADNDDGDQSPDERSRRRRCRHLGWTIRTVALSDLR
jgi:hypothetical protein